VIRFARLSAVLFLLTASFPFLPSLRAQESPVVQVTSGVSYQYIGRLDVKKLNEVLTVETPKFFGVNVTYTPASNAVKMYRIQYNSVVPELNNKPIVASGLLAIPETGGSSFPMVSYQHGTVYGKHEVPSYPEESAETELMLAQFAGQGYVVIGADYFGMGVSKEPEGYLVKASHQQATFDMLMASRAVLAQMKIVTSKLFLGGWSQGGFVTMAFLEKLESAGVPVDAAATASAPVDGYATFSGVLDYPRPFDASWLTTIFMLTSFSFENYYNEPGLARALINDQYYDVARRLYERQHVDPKEVPTDLHALIRPEYFNPQYFAASAFGRLSAQTQAYRWVIKSPVHNYYGETDEAIAIGIGQLAMNYQRAMGSGNMQVEAISTGKTTHRGTYATSAPLWKAWFDSKLGK
jgi:dienelactone hydrolase